MKPQLSLLSSIVGLVSLIPSLLPAQAQVQRLSLPRSLAGEYAGLQVQSVAIGGGKIAFGSPNALNLTGVNTGGVHVYDEKTGKYLYSLYPANGVAGDQFGYAVAIEGNRLLVGAPGRDDGGLDKGGAYLFDLTTKRQTIVNASSVFLVGEQGGKSVAMEGGFLYLGAPDGDITGSNSKSGFIVRVNATSFAAGPYYSHTTPAANDHLGAAFAVQGGLLAVGVPDDDVGALADAGSVQLFSTESSIPLRELLPASHAAGDHVGASVDLDGVTVVAGSGDALGGRGKVVSWDVSAISSPLELGIATGRTASSGLGASVSCRQGLIAVGAPSEVTDYNPGTTPVGAVWLYDRALLIKGSLRPTSLIGNAKLGSSVAISGSLVVASSPFENGINTGEGAAWRFTPVLRSQSQLFSSLVMVSGDAVSALPNVTFSAVKEAAGTGTMPVLLTSLTGTGTSGGRTSGIWSTFNPASIFGPIGLAGTNVLPGLRATSLNTLMVNTGTGDIYFRASVTGTGVTSASNQLWVRHSFGGGVLSQVLRTGDALSGGEVISSFSTARVNQTFPSDFALFLTNLKKGTGAPVVGAASDSALTITNAGSVLGYQREGTSLSPLGTAYGQMPALLALVKEKTTMIATAQPGVGVTLANNVFVDDNASTALARTGSPAPDSAGGPLSNFTAFRGAARGTNIAFQGTIATGGAVTSANNEGLWSDRVGSLRLVLRKGDPAPVIGGGVRIARVLKYGVNTANHILELVQLSGTGVNASNDQALYLNFASASEPGDFRLLLREGDTIPGTGGAKLGSILGLDLTSIASFSNSHYGVLASLVTQTGVVSSSDNLVWLVGRANAGASSAFAYSRPTVILRKGARFQGFPGQDIVTSLSMIANPADSAGTINNGLPHTLGQNFGLSTLKISFANRKTAVITIQ